MLARPRAEVGTLADRRWPGVDELGADSGYGRHEYDGSESAEGGQSRGHGDGVERCLSTNAISLAASEVTAPGGVPVPDAALARDST